MKLSANDGARWELADPVEGVASWAYTGFRILVILSNGDEFVNRRWVSGRKAMQVQEAVRRETSSFREDNPRYMESRETEESENGR